MTNSTDIDSAHEVPGHNAVDAPSISVITVCLNAADTLERTLRSVREQTYPHVEHVVIDGGSTDGSIDLLRRDQAHIAHWVSEPDQGISHAMNKGADAATGDYLIFINADDRLSDPTALERAALVIQREPGYDFYAFCIIYGAEPHSERRCSKPLGWRMRFKTSILHQSVLARRDSHQHLNGFDTRYSYALDYEYFLRAYLRGMRLLAAPEVIAFMSSGGMSTGKDWPSVRDRLQQERSLQFQHGSNAAWRLLYSLYWLAYIPFKRLKHFSPQ
jgi:glycosyltransferase involved in cell wall biosynthesis